MDTSAFYLTRYLQFGPSPFTMVNNNESFEFSHLFIYLPPENEFFTSISYLKKFIQRRKKNTKHIN